MGWTATGVSCLRSIETCGCRALARRDFRCHERRLRPPRSCQSGSCGRHLADFQDLPSAAVCSECRYSFAPASTKTWTISGVPQICAASRSDRPSANLAFTSAPAVTSMRRASTLRKKIAACSTGSLLWSRASTSAPASIRYLNCLGRGPPNRGEQHRIIVAVARVHVGTGVHKNLYFLRRCSPDRGVQKRIALIVAGVYFPAFVDERLQALRIYGAPPDRSVEFGIAGWKWCSLGHRRQHGPLLCSRRLGWA